MSASRYNSLTAWIAAIIIPLSYLVFYTPYGMDTTDFGYFYAYAWRILEGQVPYRDFAYIKPALPLYWHAFWMSLTPEKWQVLAGKAGFLLTMLATAWLGALYLRKIFNFEKLGLPLPLLAVCGFVFGIHTFPHMPWHTADGIFFSAAALFCAVSGWPIAGGIMAACAMFCKQSFLLVPLSAFIFIWLERPKRRERLYFILGWLGSLMLACAWLRINGAWEQFRHMTTGQLDIAEAIDAGILIYFRQNWIPPLLAAIPWLVARILKKPLPLSPCYLYLAILSVWYIAQVFWQKTWIGYGLSWPTLFVLLGGVCTLAPKIFLSPWEKSDNSRYRLMATACGLGAALVISWSAAISGGYKIPAFFATPLVFSFLLIHAKLGGNVSRLAWATLLCGLAMFGAGYQYPYVFPARPLERSQLNLDAGNIYLKANGVKVDADMYARLEELKYLRAKYGPDYKTLPGFSIAYYLNNDRPVYGSDWLIDWEINGEIDKFYQELLNKKLVVFMERDQMNAKQADSYARAGYGVPQRVRNNWRIVEETPHFVVFQPPTVPDKI